MASNIIPASKLNKLFPNAGNYISRLQKYSKFRCLSKITELHAHLITSGVFSTPFRPIILHSNLASSYANCGHICYARYLFDELPEPTLFLCNAIIIMYSKLGFPGEVLRLYDGVFARGEVLADRFTYPFVIKACGQLGLCRVGSVVHGKVRVGGFGLDVFVGNSLLGMYMSCGQVEMARRVFEVMGERDVVSWATMVSGYFRSGYANEALLMFDEMVGMGVEINRSSVLSVLSACRHLEDLSFGKKVHSIVEEKGMLNDVSICNSLIDMYAKCGSMEKAQNVFDRMKEKDVVTWTTMINGYVLNDRARDALEACQKMNLDGVKPNSVTIVVLLQACGSLCALEQGKCLHAWLITRNLIYNSINETALIDMYAKCNSIDLSLRVFKQSLHGKVGPWNAMISGYMHNGLASEAIHCFKQMLNEKVHPDVITVTAALVAYAKIADTRQACNFHSLLITCGFLSKNEVVRGLIYVYSKCGKLKYSHAVFNEVRQGCRDITLWSALISSYGTHGQGKIAVSLYKQMIQSGIQPNEIIYTCTLDACSHAGLVDDGLDLFKLMLKDSQTCPSMYHYTCMVDLLGRAGRLREAYDLIIKMPFPSSHAVWGSLLGACLVSGDVELGEIAARSLIDLHPENAGNYVLLANIYSASGRWDDAENTRAMINNIRSGKARGHSSIEVTAT